VIAVCLGAVALLYFLVLAQLRWQVLEQFSIFGLLFFAAVSVFAQKYQIKVNGRTEVSAGFLPDFLAAVILGPLAGGIVSASCIIVAWTRGQMMKNLFYAASFFISGAVTGIVYWALVAAYGKSGLVLALGGMAAGVAYQVMNYLLFVPVMWVRRGTSPAQLFKEDIKPFLPFQAFFLILSLGLAYAFQELGALGFALFILPVLGLIYAFRIYSREMELAQRLERFSLQMAAGMITALDLKDNYTARHSAAVAQYSFDIAKKLGLSRRECNLAHLAGLLHDLGKISVPDEVLNYQGRLMGESLRIIKDHSAAGQHILSNMSEFEELGAVVRHHHERYDGQGYPDGISGEDIPRISRIVSVADSYSAMISDRPYVAKRTVEWATAELAAQRGGQFDPEVVDAFLAVLTRQGVDYRSAEHIDFHVQFQKVRFLRDIV
jgi:putative nucleotidyltransferase with HDIG domain